MKFRPSWLTTIDTITMDQHRNLVEPDFSAVLALYAGVGLVAILNAT